MRSSRAKCASEFCRGGFDGLRHRHDEPTVAVEHLARADNRESDDLLGARGVTHDVALRGFLALGLARRPDMQIEHIALGVVVGVVDDLRADMDAHLSHDFESFWSAIAGMIRAGSCS